MSEDLTSAKDKIKIENIEVLLNEVGLISKEYERKGENFNIFQTLVLESKEVKRKMTILKFFVILGIICIMLILAVIPAALLDILLASTIGFALMLLIISIVKSKLLDFAFYPSLLFMVTIFRFSLNIASTRLILADGYTGQVIQTFGTFMTSDNIIIGVIIFLVFVIIQFLVIAKGSTSIPKVAARFTLDAIPDRQMQIDAELNAKRITEEEARAKREEIRREADFYGAMDGVSKFVRSDAIAGLIIIGINIAGGFIIGPIEKYTVLTIGSGLANQIPALLLSIASSIIIASSKFKKRGEK
jgi:flagellar biosynthesis protein FlhA